MPLTPAGRLAPVVLAALAAAVAAGGLVGVGASDTPGSGFLAVVAACSAAGVVLVAWFVSPGYVIGAGFALTVFSGRWENMDIPVPLDRMVIMAGLGAMALRALLDPARRPQLRWEHYAMLVAIAYAVLSALAAGTLFEERPLFALLDAHGVIPFLLFLFVPLAFADERDRRVLLLVLLGLGLYLGITAALEGLGAKEAAWPSYISDGSIGIAFERARGPFVAPDANGLAMYLCIIAAGIAFLHFRSRGVRWLALVVAGLCALGIVFTLTRQIWGGVALSALLTLLVTPQLRRLVVPAIVAGAVVAVGALTLVPGLSERAERRVNSDRPVWDRLNSNRAAFAMIDEKPLLGFGWSRFRTDSPSYYTLGRTYPLTDVDEVHSVVIGNLVELGFVGTLLWAVAFAGGMARALRRRGPPDLWPWKAALVALLSSWLIVANFTPLGYAFTNYAVWLFAGLVLAAGGGAAAGGRDPEHAAA